MVEHYWRNLHRRAPATQGNSLCSFPMHINPITGRVLVSAIDSIYLDVRNLDILVTEHPSAIPVVICG